MLGLQVGTASWDCKLGLKVGTKSRDLFDQNLNSFFFNEFYVKWSQETKRKEVSKLSLPMTLRRWTLKYRKLNGDDQVGRT